MLKIFVVIFEAKIERNYFRDFVFEDSQSSSAFSIEDTQSDSLEDIINIGRSNIKPLPGHDMEAGSSRVDNFRFSSPTHHLNKRTALSHMTTYEQDDSREMLRPSGIELSIRSIQSPTKQILVGLTTNRKG